MGRESKNDVKQMDVKALMYFKLWLSDGTSENERCSFESLQ